MVAKEINKGIESGEPIPIKLVFFLSLFIALGRTTLINRSNLYAEDGHEFIQAWLDHPSPFLIVTPYEGYLHVIPRIASGLISMLPPALWPLGCVILASGCLAAVATLVWASLLHSDLPITSRLLLMGIPLCSPIGSVEPIGNLANIHWFLGYLIIFAVLVKPDNRNQEISWGFVVLFCCLTEVQCALALPIIMYRILKRNKAFLLIAVGWTLGMVAQLLSSLLASRPKPRGGFPQWPAILRGYLVNVVAGSIDSRQAGSGAFIRSHGLAVIAIGFLLYVALCLIMTLRFQRALLWQVIGLQLLSILAWVLAFGANNDAFEFTQEKPVFLRWGTVASMYLLASGAISLGALLKATKRPRALGVATIVVLAALWIPSFRSQQIASAPSWESQISQSSETCQSTDTSMTILTEPYRWSITVPCRRLR